MPLLLRGRRDLRHIRIRGNSLFTPEQTTLFFEEERTPGSGFHVFLNPMNPQATYHLLFPVSVAHNFPVPKYVTVYCTWFCVLVNSPIPKNTTVIVKHRELISLSQATQAFITPIPFLRLVVIFLRRPAGHPATFASCFAALHPAGRDVPRERVGEPGLVIRTPRITSDPGKTPLIRGQNRLPFSDF